MPPASKPTASAVVEKINSDAFYEFRSVPMEGPYSAVVMSPLLRGNAAFAISMGSNDSPTAQEQVNERAFVSAFSAVPGRRLATRVWVLTPGEN